LELFQQRVLLLVLVEEQRKGAEHAYCDIGDLVMKAQVKAKRYCLDFENEVSAGAAIEGSAEGWSMGIDVREGPGSCFSMAMFCSSASIRFRESALKVGKCR